MNLSYIPLSTTKFLPPVSSRQLVPSTTQPLISVYTLSVNNHELASSSHPTLHLQLALFSNLSQQAAAQLDFNTCFETL